jgi:hypothetical protein
VRASWLDEEGASARGRKREKRQGNAPQPRQRTCYQGGGRACGLGDGFCSCGGNFKSVLYSSIKVEREEGNARRSTGTHREGGLEEGAEVDRSRLGVAEGIVDAEEVAPSDHFVDCPEPEFGHDRAELFGDVIEEVDDVLGLPFRWRELCERGHEKRGKEESEPVNFARRMGS